LGPNLLILRGHGSKSWPPPAAGCTVLRRRFRRLASSRIRSARDAQPRTVARDTELGRIARRSRGADQPQAVHWNLSGSLRRGSDRLEATSPPRKMDIAGAGTKEPRWPGGPWRGGRPGGTPVLRGFDDGLPVEAYSRASAGVKRNPARHCQRLRMALGASRRGWWGMAVVSQYNLLYLATSPWLSGAS
jgi:hypothetical protein